MKTPPREPLIRRGHLPEGGWTINFVLNGHEVQAHGQDAKTAVASMVTQTRLAKAYLTVDDAWAEANHQWLSRTPERLHATGARTFLQSRLPKAEPLALPYGPAQWGPTAWKFINLYLAQSTYSQKVFESLLTLVQDMVNPSSGIGCHECLMHFQKRGPAPETLKEARTWMYNFHDAVNLRLGKPRPPYSSIAKEYKWS